MSDYLRKKGMKNFEIIWVFNLRISSLIKLMNCPMGHFWAPILMNPTLWSMSSKVKKTLDPHFIFDTLQLCHRLYQNIFFQNIFEENIFIRVRKIFINNFYRFHKWWNYSIFQKRKSHFEEDTSTEKDFLFFRENQRKIAPWRVQITVQNLQT